MSLHQWQWVHLVEALPRNYTTDGLSDEDAHKLTCFNKDQLWLEDSRSYYYSSTEFLYWRRDSDHQFKWMAAGDPVDASSSWIFWS
jgi:hypothetical protein